VNPGRIAGHYPDAAWTGDLAGAFPKFAEGLARVGDLINRDGALSARDKQLAVAAIGAVKRLDAVTRTALGRSFDLGLTANEAWGAAINVMISRGMPSLETFVAAIEAHRPGSAPTGSPFAEQVTTQQIMEYYDGLYGTAPPSVGFGARYAPDAVQGYYLMRQAALDESPLAPLLADLILVSVNTAELQEDFVEIHARFALRGGATAPQLAEAAACAIPFAGVAAWLRGANGCLAALESP
jgi:alkylhydroperoxidase/carboxymuconolactone decarboxylase family protein YurZ